MPRCSAYTKNGISCAGALRNAISSKKTNQNRDSICGSTPNLKEAAERLLQQNRQGRPRRWQVLAFRLSLGQGARPLHLPQRQENSGTIHGGRTWAPIVGYLSARGSENHQRVCACTAWREQWPIFKDEVLALSPPPIRDIEAGPSRLRRQRRSFDYAVCLNDKLTGER